MSGDPNLSYAGCSQEPVGVGVALSGVYSRCMAGIQANS